METDLLADLIDRKLQALELLTKIAQQQCALIDGGDMTRLLQLLSAKQTLLNHMQQLDQNLELFRGQDADARVWVTPAKRARCQEQAERCNQLLAGLMELEKRDEAVMIRRRDEVAERLHGVHNAAAARQAYAADRAVVRPGIDLAMEG